MDAIIVVDSRHRVAVFNRAAEDVFRCAAAEAIGAHLNKFLPARFHEAHEQHIRHYAGTGATTRSMHSPGMVVGLRADGDEFPAEATISQGEAGGERFFAVILRDVTERRKHEETAHLLASLQVEQEVRLYQHELAIAGAIQQRLMCREHLRLPFATIRGRSAPCKEVGGDFFDAIETSAGLAVVIADVCGKGIAAALLASTLQGMVYAQLNAHVPLDDIAAGINRFLCHRSDLQNYATMILAHLSADGFLRYVSCGHVPPLLISGGTVRRLEGTNLPLGLFPAAMYQLVRCDLRRGDSLLFVTDGVTEAVNGSGEFFSDERLETVAMGAEERFERILRAVDEFRGDTPLKDDCTVVSLDYQGVAGTTALPAAAGR